MWFAWDIVFLFCSDHSIFWHHFLYIQTQILIALIPWYSFPSLNWVMNLSLNWGRVSQIEILKQCICTCTVSKWKECGFGLNKISSQLQGNRRWQPMVLLEEELHYLSISTVTFPKTEKMWNTFTKWSQ